METHTYINEEVKVRISMATSTLQFWYFY